MNDAHRLIFTYKETNSGADRTVSAYFHSKDVRKVPFTARVSCARDSVGH